MTMGQRMMAFTGWPFFLGGVKRAPEATRRAAETRSGWVEDTTRRMLTEPEVDSSTSKVTVPRVTPLRESELGKEAEPWRRRRGVPSSSLVL
jgi:hypothetical protein